jgi:HlyD family secretion protein
MVSGNIEATQVQLGFKISGRLIDRLADEGDRGVAGQKIAVLDATDQRIAVARAEAELAYRKSIAAELKAGSRPEEIQQAAARVQQARFALDELVRGSRVQVIADARSELDRALAAEKAAASELELARSDNTRYAVLVQEEVVSQRDFDVVRTRLDAAYNAWLEAQARAQSAKERLSLAQEGPRTEQIQQARAALRQAEAEYALVQAGPRSETIAQALAQVAVAEQTLSHARQQLAETEIFSPIDGVVLSKSAEPGEFLNPGAPVVMVGDLINTWVRAFVNEKDLGRIRLNQPAQITTDAYPKEVFKGKIRFIDSQAAFTPKSVQTFEERVKLMYRIKIEVINPDLKLKPGMPADALILPES